MRKIYVCSPYRGDEKRNVENAIRYCQSVRFYGMPIAPHIYFTQFMDDSSMTDRKMGLEYALELLRGCDEVYVFADEVSEGMIAEIKEAKKRKIPLKFHNSEGERINYDTLIINQTIGPGYRQIIEESVNPGGGDGKCPYAGICTGEKQEGEKERSSRQTESGGDDSAGRDTIRDFIGKCTCRISGKITGRTYDRG